MYSLAQLTVIATAISSVAALGTVRGGALDPLNRAQQPDKTAATFPNKPVKLVVTNKALQTVYAEVVTGAGFPKIPGFGPIAPGQTGSTTIPQKSAGHITLGKDTNDLGSKIQVNNDAPPTPSNATQIFMNLSLVDGYSLPIVCSCTGLKTGCNKDLFSLGSCPSGQLQGPVCLNKSPANGPPQAFFAPCRNDAYTYPNQPGAGTGGFCSNYEIDCCVGNGC